MSILITYLGLCSQNDWMYGQMASHRMPSNKLWMYYSKIALDKLGWLKTIYYLPISQLWKCVDNSNEKIIDLRKSWSWLAIFVVVRCSRLWPSTIYWHDDRHICVIHTHTHTCNMYSHIEHTFIQEKEKKKGPFDGECLILMNRRWFESDQIEFCHFDDCSQNELILWFNFLLFVRVRFSVIFVQRWMIWLHDLLL